MDLSKPLSSYLKSATCLALWVVKPETPQWARLRCSLSYYEVLSPKKKTDTRCMFGERVLSLLTAKDTEPEI